MVAHYNYYPPAGSVIDMNDPAASWNGKAWMKGGRVIGIPSTHTLVGKPGGMLSGWHYDWNQRAWIDPSSPPPNGGAPATHGLTLGHPIATHPMIAGFHPSLSGLVHPVAHPAAPAAPHPAPVAPQPQTPAAKPEDKECHMEKKDHNTVLEYLIKHPIAPLVGGFVLIGSLLSDEPAPPAIPDGLPEPIAKQWQMIYTQNLQRFQRRMAVWENVGKILLGYSDTSAVIAALPPKKTA